MLNEVFLLYLFTRLDILHGICVAGTVLGIIYLPLSFGIRYGEGIKAFPIKTVVAIWVSFALGAALIPSQKDALFIIAGTGVIEAAKTDTAQRLASKSVQVVEKALDDYLKQQSTTKEKSK